MKILIGFYIFLLINVSMARQFFVSEKGNDNNPGTKEQPFRTIQRAADIMVSGDTCYIRAGRYHETVIINGKKAGGGKFLVFQAYPGEKVILDGTEPIHSRWKLFRGKIYMTKLRKDIWQLFVDGESMVSARWPNGYWHDGSIWDRKRSWAKVDPRSRYGVMYNKEMAKTGINFTGAIAIMNIGSFRTFQRFVEGHKKGSDHFYYPKDLWKRLEWEEWFVNKNREGYFYLEGKLECLDSAKEWFYNPDTKELYLWADDGKNPTGRDIRGKTQSYAFDLKNSSYVIIKGLEFFGTTFRAEDCDHIKVEDCHFLYPSYSKRMLRDINSMDVTKMVTKDEFDPAYNTIRNCIFEYMDGPAIEMSGVGNLVENCYIHDVDYSCTYEGGWTIHMVRAPDLIFRRNTVHTTGASELFKSGKRNLIEFNNLYLSGFLQNDGALIQVSAEQQYGTIVRYNWVHNSVKQGIRFDNSNLPNSPWGTNGTVHHNVAWKTQRVYFKGDYHQIYHNLSFDSELNDLIVSSEISINGRNFFTITRNNVAGKLSGNRSQPIEKHPVPGIVDHNWAGNILGKNIRTQLRDPDNLDFRPKAGSELVDAGIIIQNINDHFLGKAPDIGPYEFGDVNYWIPGYQAPHASTPIPPDGAINVKVDADLMWLQGYKATSHDIYFGTDSTRVALANRKAPEFKGNLKNNIFSPGFLERGKIYYWRIDAIRESKVIKGTVWKFQVEE